VETKGHQHFISQEVFLKDASPDTIRVEVYADGIKVGSAVKYEMTRARQPPDRAGGYTYRASVSSARPATDYTARIMAHCDGLATQLEAGWILWQK
jgi:starch phosphorylase